MNRIKMLIYRYDPKHDKKPRYDEYDIPYNKFMTVLEALIYIYKKIDPTLAFDYECKIGYCGKCALRYNNRIVLACKTLITKEINVIEPLPNMSIIRDLVTDREKMLVENNRIKGLLIHRKLMKKV